jgi:predicted MFS family arabinose efflux permease
MICVVVAVSLLVVSYDRAWLQVANIAVLGATNGYLQSVCCCHAPAMCSEKEQGTLGNLIVIMITLGISVGGAIQIPLSKL